VDEVTVFFTATNGHKYVDDLTEQEANVKDDNKPPAKISAFSHQSDLPLRLGLLIDTSDSVHYRFGFEQQAASRFLHKIVRLRKDHLSWFFSSDHRYSRLHGRCRQTRERCLFAPFRWSHCTF
jgi:hypothetical protein